MTDFIMYLIVYMPNIHFLPTLFCNFSFILSFAIYYWHFGSGIVVCIQEAI